jgi:hypothetical protein
MLPRLVIRETRVVIELSVMFMKLVLLSKLLRKVKYPSEGT